MAANGASAEYAELFFVNLLEQGALVEFRRTLKVAKRSFFVALKTLILRPRPFRSDPEGT